MKKYSIILFIVLISFSTSIGQDLDSLVQEIKIQKDTIQINSLIHLGKKLRRSNPDSSLVTLQIAILNSEKLGFPKGKMVALQNRGITYGMKHEYAKSISDFNEAVRLGIIHKNLELTASSYNGLGIVYKRIGDYVTSLKYYNEALVIYKKDGAIKGESSTYANLGVLYDLMGEYENSYKYYSAAYKIDDSLNYTTNKHSLLTNIAIYHIRKEEFSKAIKIIQTNVKYYDSINDINKLIVQYNNLGFVYKLMKKYDSSIYYSSKNIELVSKTQNKPDAADAYLNRSMAYYKKGMLKEAEQDAETNFELTKVLGFANRLESYELKATINKALGNYKKAYLASEKVVALKDSLFEENKVQQYKAEQIKQQVYAKNEQIANQEKDIDVLNKNVQRKKEWNLFLIIIAGLFLISIVLLYQKYTFRNKANKVLTSKNKLILDQKNEIEIINKELENRMLRAQINPHFIFNALNSIQHFITIKDTASTLKYLTKFSSLLRQILENSISAKVSLVDEIKFLKIYIDLEALRFDHSFSYNIQIDETLNLHDIEVPILFLQPFVENAILHGLLPKQGDKHLFISISQETNFVIFEIKDNGIGRKAAALLKENKNIHHKSRGLSVTEQRIKMLQKENKKGTVIFEDLIDTKENALGTKIIITVPIEE